MTNLVKCDHVLTMVMLYYTKAWKSTLPCFWTIVLTWQANILLTLLNYGITIINAHKSMLLPWHMSKNMPIPCSFFTPFVHSYARKASERIHPSLTACVHDIAQYIHCTTV